MKLLNFCTSAILPESQLIVSVQRKLCAEERELVLRIFLIW